MLVDNILIVSSKVEAVGHSFWTAWPAKMGQIDCPEMSVNMLCNIPEEWRQLFCGRCLKFLTTRTLFSLTFSLVISHQVSFYRPIHQLAGMLLIEESESHLQLLGGFPLVCWIHTGSVLYIWIEISSAYFPKRRTTYRHVKNSQAMSCILIGKNYWDAHLLHSYKMCDAQTLHHV